MIPSGLAELVVPKDEFVAHAVLAMWLVTACLAVVQRNGICRTERRFTARVFVSDKLCSSFFLLPRARFLSSNNLGEVVMSASVSSQTSIESHYASECLCWSLRPDRYNNTIAKYVLIKRRHGHRLFVRKALLTLAL